MGIQNLTLPIPELSENQTLKVGRETHEIHCVGELADVMGRPGQALTH